jgi:hypothetical protein
MITTSSPYSIVDRFLPYRSWFIRSTLWRLVSSGAYIVHGIMYCISLLVCLPSVGFFAGSAANLPFLFTYNSL